MTEQLASRPHSNPDLSVAKVSSQLSTLIVFSILAALLSLCFTGCSNTPNDQSSSKDAAESRSLPASETAEPQNSTTHPAVILEIDNPDDRSLINSFLDYFTESLHVNESFSVDSIDLQELTGIAVHHLGLYNMDTWEYGDYNSLVGSGGGANGASNVRISADTIEREASRFVNEEVDLSGLGTADGQRFKYLEGYVYFGITIGPGQTAHYAAVTDIEQEDSNTYRVAFDVLTNGMPFGCDSAGTQFPVDDDFFSLSSFDMQHELGITDASFKGYATVVASEKATGKSLSVLRCEIDEL